MAKGGSKSDALEEKRRLGDTHAASVRFSPERSRRAARRIRGKVSIPPRSCTASPSLPAREQQTLAAARAESGVGAALAEIARVALPGARREEPELNKELGEKAAERPGGAAPQPPSGAPSDSRANIPPRCFLPARETLLPLSWSPGGPARRPGPARRGAARRNVTANRAKLPLQNQRTTCWKRSSNKGKKSSDSGAEAGPEAAPELGKGEGINKGGERKRLEQPLEVGRAKVD